MIDEPNGTVTPASMQLPDRACGTCTLCCKLLEIDTSELTKPPGVWGQHCTPGQGCGIYPTRPRLCRTFACGWLINPRLGAEWKPNRAKIVLNHDIAANGVSRASFVVDPSFPGRWREEPYYSVIRQCAYRGLAARGAAHCWTYIRIAQRALLVLPHEEVDVADSLHTVVQTGEARWEVLCFENDDEAREFAREFDEAVAAKAASLRAPD
jgi:hypothetical protein